MLLKATNHSDYYRFSYHWKEFGETTSDLFEYVHSVVNRFNVGLSQVQLKSALTAGSCLLLFDGMDEIRSSDLTRFSSGLESLACGYSNNYFVLSSRPSWLLSRMSNFCEMELQPFSKKQAVKMIDNFTFSDGEEKVKSSFPRTFRRRPLVQPQGVRRNSAVVNDHAHDFWWVCRSTLEMYKFYEAVFETLAKNTTTLNYLQESLNPDCQKMKLLNCWRKFASCQPEKKNTNSLRMNSRTTSSAAGGTRQKQWEPTIICTISAETFVFCNLIAENTALFTVHFRSISAR